jgi:sulfur carrier protein
MNLTVNGKPMEADPGMTVEALLARLSFPPRRLAVAVNGEVLPRSEHPAQILREGDEIEVIQAVAGG